ncbi:MAG: hypothetical protein E7263_04430 [Lachnospiraceae bacterium]|nr:hypothetical protein [Lachnospiraceae bacterium]
MRKGSRLFTRMVTFAFAGVMAVGICGNGNVVNTFAAEEDWSGSFNSAVEIDSDSFPDANFREFVKKYDLDKDDILSLDELDKVTYMECEKMSIADFTGIEYFGKLTRLSVGNNDMKTLDVTSNINLEVLECRNCDNLETLKVSGCYSLTKIDCFSSNVSSLDLTNLRQLETLSCSYNNIEELDLSTNINLKSINSTYNKLTELDVTKLTKLESLYCSNNQITKLDVSKNTALLILECSKNKITELDVSKNTKLTYLKCSNNTIAALNVKNHTELEYLYCYSNSISSLDVSNSKKLIELYCGGNQLSSMDVSNNTYLKIFNCASNNITELDLKNNSKLYELGCSNNQLTELNLENNSELNRVDCEKNNITVLDVTNTPDVSVSCDNKVLVIRKWPEGLSLNTTSTTLRVGDFLKLEETISPEDSSIKDVTWESSNPDVATVDQYGGVHAKANGTAIITATIEGKKVVKATCTITVGMPEVNVNYRTHIQSYGWEGEADDITTWKKNGAMSGTSGKAKRLEGINIVVSSTESDEDIDLGVQYTTHCQSYGWLPWSADGDMNGTEGEAKRLEAIMIKLTCDDAKDYDIYYRVHAQSYGWLGWASNGAPAGTAGYGKRLEGIQIVVVRKGQSFNKAMENIVSVKTESFVAKEGSSPITNSTATSNVNPIVPGAETINVAYRTHVQSYGWQGWKYNGQMSGTSGEGKRLEGIDIKLTNKDHQGDIIYTTHVQSYGWQGELDDPVTWKKNGEMSGTSGEGKRLEAICVNLTGEMSEFYDIYYRVHAQSYGWLGWAKNGEESGTAGYGKRLEGIQIVIVPKNQEAPSDSYGGIISVYADPYIEKQ